MKADLGMKTANSEHVDVVSLTARRHQEYGSQNPIQKSTNLNLWPSGFKICTPIPMIPMLKFKNYPNDIICLQQAATERDLYEVIRI